MSDKPRIPERSRRRIRIVALGVAVVATIATAMTALGGGLPNPFRKASPIAAIDSPFEDPIPIAKIIRPKRETSVTLQVEQIAAVEPFYRADLRARASGIVKAVHRDIGDRVRKGELLIEIDVPESEQDVAKCAAMVLQREQELKVSRAKLKDARAAKDVSAATIRQREADVVGLTATRDFRKRKLERYRELAAKGSVVGSVVEEEERDYLASEASVVAAKANVERARADYSESESKVEAADADIELKLAQIEVARKDLDRAKAVADYGKVLAPFDGVVVRRAIDPGSFVQNATTGSSEPLIAISRVDLITFSAKFPDSVAPLISRTAMAQLRVNDLPGWSLTTPITRFAPSVQNADHTMRVEVDVFNGDDADYDRLVALVKAGGADRPTKSPNDPMPARAFAPGAPATRRLLPGMTGTVELSLGGFGESYVIPSTAIYSRGGASYLLVLENEKTRQVPIRVQLNDGKTARVAILKTQRDREGKIQEQFMELTGEEEIVAARQLELGDGATVKRAIAEW